MKQLSVELNSKDEIVIRIPKSHLAHLAKMHIEDELSDDGIRLTNPKALATDVFEQLEEELDETGDTLVYRMLSEAIESAIENGSEAFDDEDANAEEASDPESPND